MQAMIQHDILRWAVERAQISIEALSKKLSVKADKIEKWVSGEAKPTFKQAQNLAEKLHIPFGYLYLSKPPVEELPIPDFRTIKNKPTHHTSVYLTELIYDLDRKQRWYRDYMIDQGHDPLSFIGSVTLQTPVEAVAKQIRTRLRWDEALAQNKGKENFIYAMSRKAEAIGVLVMRSSYSGTGTRNTIAVEEIRGLAIADSYAPLIFINSADTNSAQIFTLAHELAHLWLGESGISDLDMLADEEQIEKQCNAIAGETVVPKEHFQNLWNHHLEIRENLKSVSDRFLVSEFVALKRAYDLNYLAWDTYREYYEKLREEWERIKATKNSGGGNYYNTKPAKESRRFSTAVVGAAKEGKLLYRDAMELLNMKSFKAFDNFAKQLGYN